MSSVQPVSLHDATRERYLAYAMSVITSRALPDARDGLKPVQRRILYTMFHDLSLHPSGRFKKSAAVVGDVMGKYHPHGDQSIYDALVRMAQTFSLRYPLVTPQGNFGSLDGDPPAAMRYTECKLAELAEELLQELKKRTVDYRPTYDGQRFEPIVLPAQVPQMLINGVEGIAVGMATRIPPHNLGEVCTAAAALIDNRDLTIDALMNMVLGPDFPTGGKILNDRASLLEIYTEGRGSVRLRGTWRIEKANRRQLIVIDNIPYAVNKAKLVEKIGDAVARRQLPQVIDVRDESTDIVRIVLELKQGTSPDAVMAWVCKRTPLETTFPVQMNALVPTDRPDVCVPERLDLRSALLYWLDFRFETVRRRLTYDLQKLEERIHLLEGFAIIFADLDEVIRIIRHSEGKKDAARKLMDRFPLDEVQTEAILELKLYRIARLEIALVLDELDEKRAAAAEIRALLADTPAMWARVKSELLEVRELYADERRTLVGEPVKDLTFDESAYIVREDTFVVVTRDGWIKRQNSFSDVGRIRVRDGDTIGWLHKATTTDAVTLFMSTGSAHTIRVGDIASTSGYGAPLSASVKLDDGAKVIGVVVHGSPALAALPALVDEEIPEDERGPYVASITRLGKIQRFALAPFAELSTRNGRRFARLGANDEVLLAAAAGGLEHVCVATAQANLLAFPLLEAPLLKAAGKGTTAIKLRDDDHVIAVDLSASAGTGPEVVTTHGRTVKVTPRQHAGSRGARGQRLLRRGGLEPWTRELDIWLGQPDEEEEA
ncbi:MAG: DNA gyrase/topoisomerase IV subunit A [Myxococcota bacterium]